MPLTLRKACHACTKSKRRCLPQLPSCDRCAKKQIPCIYDLEPVSQGRLEPTGQQDFGRSVSGSGTGHDGHGRTNDAQIVTDDLEIVYNSVIAAKDASVNAVADGYSTTSLAAQPRLMATGEMVTWLLDFLAQVARDGLAGKGTPFMHQHILDITSSTVSVDATSAKIEIFKQLTHIHQLTTQCLQTLILHKPAAAATSKPDDACEHLVTTTFQTIHNLWSSPPQQFDASFSQWEAWLTAESIRRSIFIGIVIRGLFKVGQTGYIRYEPFFESSPFDPRSGLWEADISEEWERAIESHGGDHVLLKSYHEFITGSGSDTSSGYATATSTSLPELKKNEDGAFQRMLFVMYHGNAGIQYLRDIDRQSNGSQNI